MQERKERVTSQSFPEVMEDENRVDGWAHEDPAGCDLAKTSAVGTLHRACAEE